MFTGKGRPAPRRPWLWHMSYLSAGVAIQSQKGLWDEARAPQAALPGATGFHPCLTQKNLMEENKRPKSSLICCQPAAVRRLPSAAVTRQAGPKEPSGRGLPAWSPVLRASNDSNFTNSQGLPGRVTMSTGEGFLPLVGVSSPFLLLWQILDSAQPVR